MSLLPSEWVRWVTGREDVVETHPVAVERELLSRRTDAVVLVWSASEGQFLVLTEVQLRYRTEMPYRMNAYAGLVAEKYRAPVFPVLVNILPASEATVIPHRYESVCLGRTSRQDYHVINLWEIDDSAVIAHLSGTLKLMRVPRPGPDSMRHWPLNSAARVCIFLRPCP